MSLASTVSRSVALGRLGVDIARARRRAGGPGEAAARRLVAARMGQLRGLPQKIGQVLSLGEIDTGGDIYAGLTESEAAAPAGDSLVWIERELGQPLSRAFRAIEPAARAASLGQVHRAVLHDGRVVAVKVQYPDIAGAVDADLAALGLLAAPVTARHAGFNLGAYRGEMRRNLLGELDYHAEAAALRRFAARRHDVPGLVTPDPLDRWSTSRLLTMTWVEGDAVTAARQWPAAARRDALLVLLRTFLRGCFTWRELHADPHAGNLRFTRGDDGVSVGLLDFGSTKQLTPGESWGLQQLACHGTALSDDDLAGAWMALGFGPDVTTALRHRLRPVTAILFEPFAADAPFDAAGWEMADRLADALGDDRWTFRFGGPAALVFLIRAFQGLLVYARALGMPLNWRHELDAVLAGSTAAAAPPLRRDAPASALASTTLRFEVTRRGEAVARLGFPAAAMECLAELVPADLLPRLAARGIDPAALAAASLARACPPGDVFTLDDEDTTVRVWLD